MVITNSHNDNYQENVARLEMIDSKGHIIKIVVKSEKNERFPIEIAYRTYQLKKGEEVSNGVFIWRNGRVDVNTLFKKWQINQVYTLLQFMEIEFDARKLL